MPSNDPLLIPGAEEVKVRLYGQGLGDCFLLAFPTLEGSAEKATYMVIDCGAAKSTPERRDRAEAVVEDISAATGGRIDALVVTHQHFDHISGFQDAWEAWSRMEIGALYLPWTESGAESGEFASAKRRRDALERAAKKTLELLRRDDVLDLLPELRAEADFLGVAADGDPPSDMDETMEFIRSLCPDEIHYFEPGDVFRLPGSDCHGYVLGPPLADTEAPDGKRYIELLVDEDDEVMYNYGQLGMEVDHGKPGGSTAFALSDDSSLPALASSLMLDGEADRSSDEAWSPFESGVRLDWDAAMKTSFFQDHYGGAVRGRETRGLNGSWRRVDDDWLLAASRLALRAGNFTNNLSLVLAFDVPGSDRMLLFPGDAQVGNWLSWHTIDRWRPRGDARPANPPTANGDQTLMENLLSRVSFYKVGHHGSHNATIRNQGLEAMTREDLAAYVPVSVPVAQDRMGYCPMPFYPVMRALHRRAAGRVFLPSGKTVRFGESAKLDAEAAAKHDRRMLKQAGLTRSKQQQPAIANSTRFPEPGYPLYLELTVG